MMNVPIICYAARATNDLPRYALACQPCRTTERMLVRPDGGTAHEGGFDPEIGAVLRQATHQGLRADADWSRGLAWSLPGFGSRYTDTDDPAVTERNADQFMARCSENFVPPLGCRCAARPRPDR